MSERPKRRANMDAMLKMVKKEDEDYEEEDQIIRPPPVKILKQEVIVPTAVPNMVQAKKSTDLLSAALNQSGLSFVGGVGAPPVPGISGGMYSNNILNTSASQAMMQMGASFDEYIRKYLPDPKELVMPNPQQSLAALHQMYAGITPQHAAAAAASAPAMTSRDISNLWMNADIKLKNLPVRNANAAPIPDESVEEEEDELGHQETYAEYMPSKLKVGERHPDSVVETSSLSSVQPPDVWYSVSLPEETINKCKLSALQLEAIVYASQQHECFLPDGSRAGYLVGDGAGVGKGRTIAGIIYENYLMGRKRALWLSVSNDLKYDSERDLRDIGASKIDVHLLSKFKYAKISSKVNGSVKKGVIFSTYSSLIGESQSGGKYRTRLKQLLHWCGEDFDGVIVFDECHKAKNLCPVGSSKPTKTGLTVLELQNKLPKARVVYASATGASEPKNMAYMTRLGIWGEGTPFPEFSDFIFAVEKRGVGAMEVVAMDMKLRGMYIARQLSFSGVTFKIEELPLSDSFLQMYDQSVQLWCDAREKFQSALEIMTSDRRLAKTMWGQFWSSHQRFFKYLCIAAKVPHVVRIAREAVKDGKCVVIGLQSTGEARTLEQLEEAGGELNDFVSTAKGVFQSLIDKHFPAPNRSKMNKILGLNKVISESRSCSSSPAPAEPGSSSGNRNPVLGKRNAAKNANKRYKEVNSDSDSENDQADNESDFIMSDSNDDDNDSDAESSGKSSSENDDYNPFGDVSDSDEDDPWLKRMKKSNKSKAIKAKKEAKILNGKGYTYEPPPQLTAPPVAPTMDAVERASAMKMDLLEKLDILSDKLPPNTLDQLIDELGGTENVAEMTGRKGRVVSTEDGNVQYESRSEIDVPLETLNLTEKKRFMDGDKTIAVISEAASSGISLQADRRVANQARRVHITLELPWSADRAIQQFGRTHRSNQVNAPEYIFMISDLAGERRFASTVAKRLESLGALTHGDRRATESRDLSRFNIDNKYGRAALEVVMRSLTNAESPLVDPPSDYVGDFLQDARMALVGVGLITFNPEYHVFTLDKDYSNMSKFLNRILGIKVKLQNALFKYFTETLEAVIFQAKRTGKWDMGILDLGTDGDTVKRVECRTFLSKHATGSAMTELNTISVERGMSWDDAMEVWAELVGKDEGFYISHTVRNNKKTAVLAVQHSARKKDSPHKKEKLYRIYRPNTGLQVKMESKSDLVKKYAKVSSTDLAQPHWQQQYEASNNTCSHAYWNGTCKRVTVGLTCDVGLRQRTYNILGGSVLNMWTKVESVLSSAPGSQNSKMQIMRVKTDQGKIVGVTIPNNCMQPLIHMMTENSSKMDVQKF